MADHNDSRSPGGAKRGRRGSVKNSDRLEAFEGRNKQGNADWGGCNGEKLQEVIVAITGLGGAITLSLSRDLGAYSLTLMLDGARQTLWFNGDSDLDVELDEVKAVLQAMTG